MGSKTRSGEDSFALFATAVFVLLMMFGSFTTACAQNGNPKDGRPSKPEPQKQLNVWLNEELMGNTGDLSKLSAALKSIMEKRMSDGVFISVDEETDGVVAPPRLQNDIFLFVEPDMALKDLIPVYDTLKEYCTVIIPMPEAKREPPTPLKPNPLFLALTVGGSKPNQSVWESYEYIDWKSEHSFLLTLSGSDDPFEMQFFKIQGALEILADGSMVVNDPYEKIDPNGDLNDYPPKRRDLGSSLEDEISKLAKTVDNKARRLSIIASGTARYKDLAEILKFSEKHKLSFEILLDITD